MLTAKTLRGFPASEINSNETSSARRARPAIRRGLVRDVMNWLPMVLLALCAGLSGIWRISDGLKAVETTAITQGTPARATSVADGPLQRLATNQGGGTSSERSATLIP